MPARGGASESSQSSQIEDNDAQERDCLRTEIIELQMELQQSKSHIRSLKVQLEMLQQAMLEDSLHPPQKPEHIHDPLLMAVETANIDIFTQIIAHASAESINGALCLACQTGNLEMVRCLVEANGADVHTDCDSPLLWACNGGHADIVKLLVRCGANVNVLGGHPLRIAIRSGAQDVIQFLLENGSIV